MADHRLRQLERRAANGGPQEIAQLALARVQYGELPANHILYAAFLGDKVMRGVRPEYQIVIDCAACLRREEERTRRTRERTRVPLRETPRQCMACKGTKRIFLKKGLIPFVQGVEDVPHDILIAWAADCAEHQVTALSPRNPHAHQGRYRLPNQPERNPYLAEKVLPLVRAYLATKEIDPLIYQQASVSAGVTAKLGVPMALVTMIALANLEGTDNERKVRFRAAEIASRCYHVANGTRVERNWQERRLIQYLLGSRPVSGRGLELE